METTTCSVAPRRDSARTIAGLLLDALTRRDFGAIRAVRSGFQASTR